MEAGVPRDRVGIVNELHTQARRNFPRRFVTVKGLFDLYQADLVDMTAYAKENRGFRYLLTLIDTFSKRGWGVPLRTKTGDEVASALHRIFGSLKQSPKFLQTDQGTEFFNSSVAKVLKKYNIRHYSTFSILKASIVERFNRTIKNWMWKQFSLQGSYEWVKIIDKIIARYNGRRHRSIGMAPRDVNEENEHLVYKQLVNHIKLAPKKTSKFKVDDPVRISKYKHVFEKGYTPNWTTEVFFISEVLKTRPVSYKLRDGFGHPIEGGFYSEELLKTRFKDTYLIERVVKRRNGKLLVKWLGYDKKYNQWIPESALVT